MKPPTAQVIAQAWRTVALFTWFRARYSWDEARLLTQWKMDYVPRVFPVFYPGADFE